jgi:trans-aconitate 2-methyltransferase
MALQNRDSWNPEQYEKFKNQRSLPFFDLMGLLTSVSDANVIDLGCGTGELTGELHRHLTASSTLGLDSSDEMLRAAAVFVKPGLRFEKGHIESWAPTAAEYDIVFSNAAFQWVGDHRALFARVHAALKPGGQVAVQMPMNHDYPTHVIASQMSHEPRWKARLKGQVYDKFSSLLSVEDYASLLFKLGFTEQSVSLKVYPQVMDSRDGVVEWVRGSMLTYFQSRLTPEDFSDFVSEFEERLFKILPDDEPFFYPFKRVLMWARLPSVAE